MSALERLTVLDYPLRLKGTNGWDRPMPDGVEGVHGGDRANVFKAVIGGKPLCIKVFHDRRFRSRLRNRLGFSKARRAFTNGLKLWELGVPVPRPIALAEYRFRGMQILVSEFSGDGETVRTAVFKGANPRPLLKKCAALTRMLAEKGVFHKDYGARNILLDGERLLLIDWEDVCFTACHAARLHQKLKREFLWRQKRDSRRMAEFEQEDIVENWKTRRE